MVRNDSLTLEPQDTEVSQSEADRLHTAGLKEAIASFKRGEWYIDKQKLVIVWVYETRTTTPEAA